MSSLPELKTRARWILGTALLLSGTAKAAGPLCAQVFKPSVYPRIESIQDVRALQFADHRDPRFPVQQGSAQYYKSPQWEQRIRERANEIADALFNEMQATLPLGHRSIVERFFEKNEIIPGFSKALLESVNARLNEDGVRHTQEILERELGRVDQTTIALERAVGELSNPGFMNALRGKLGVDRREARVTEMQKEVAMCRGRIQSCEFQIARYHQGRNELLQDISAVRDTLRTAEHILEATRIGLFARLNRANITSEPTSKAFEPAIENIQRLQSYFSLNYANLSREINNSSTLIGILDTHPTTTRLRQLLDDKKIALDPTLRNIDEVMLAQDFRFSEQGFAQIKARRSYSIEQLAQKIHQDNLSGTDLLIETQAFIQGRLTLFDADFLGFVKLIQALPVKRFSRPLAEASGSTHAGATHMRSHTDHWRERWDRDLRDTLIAYHTRVIHEKKNVRGADINDLQHSTIDGYAVRSAILDFALTKARLYQLTTRDRQELENLVGQLITASPFDNKAQQQAAARNWHRLHRDAFLSALDYSNSKTKQTLQQLQTFIDSSN